MTRPTYIFRAKGANRIIYQHATRVSEVFDKNSAPPAGSVGVVVQRGYQVSDDAEIDEREFVVALAAIRGIAGVASGAVRATLAPVHRLRTPVPIADLQSEPLPLGAVTADFYSRQLDTDTAASLFEQLERHAPGVAEWLAAVLQEPRDFPAAVQRARAEARDAVKLAAQFAEFELPPDAFVSTPPADDDETLLQTVINAGYEQDLEEELLPLDLQRFDGKLTGKQRAASLAVFSDKNGRERLVVMSVNKKPIEEELGVDLLYWDQVHDAFTLVQYKRLEKLRAADGQGGYEWGYRREAEIAKQLDLMPAGRGSAASAGDWRATGTPFWFKFVRGDAARELDDKTLRGMNVPADWLRLAMQDGTLKSGPKGGFRITYDNAKYISRDAFTHLITRGFVGSAGARSKAFRKVLKTRQRELIIAVRKDWQQDEQPLPESLDGEGPASCGPLKVPELPF